MKLLRDRLGIFKGEIGEYLDFLKILDSIEDDEEVSKIILKVLPNGKRPYIMLKATVFILVYNMVENIVCSTIKEIYDKINKSDTKYKDLIQNIQLSFIKEKKIDCENDYKKVFFLIDELMMESFHLETFIDGNEEQITNFKRKFKINGTIIVKNLNHTMEEVLNLNITEGIGENINNISGVLASRRNELSHGISSFHDIGKQYSVQELEKIFETMYNFLEEFINKSENYLNKKLYLRNKNIFTYICNMLNEVLKKKEMS